jgi:lipopolysaccharide export LptBFGC system permease protein LptF
VNNHDRDYWKTPFVARAALIVVMMAITVLMLVLITLAHRSNIWYALGVGISIGAWSWLIRAERFHRWPNQ